MNGLGFIALTGFFVACGLGWYWFVERPLRSKVPPQIPEPKTFKEVLDAISKPAVVKPRYVCGFAFHGDNAVRPKVVLIRKVKPDWQKGKLNGVGGKIEKGESPERAMEREFFEEAGVRIFSDRWQVFARMDFPKAEVFFLRTFEPVASLARTQTVWSEEVGAMITESVEHRAVRGIDEIPDGAIMPNLRWAIPMGFHTEGERSVVTVEYTAHN